MLGHKLVAQWREKFDVWTTIKGDFEEYRRFDILDESKTFDRLNVENYEKIAEILETVQPEVVINAVGVIKQRQMSKDIVQTLGINSIFPHRLAALTRKARARLITVSTDCVFSGERGNYTETDIPDALDLYGQSKHFGELDGEHCLTLRTSIIGRELLTRRSLVEWFLSNEGKKIKGFVNAIYSGFPTVCFAGIMADIIINHPELSGLYHVSSDPIDKFSLLRLFKEAYKIEVEIEKFEDFRIDRSLNSAKFRQITGFQPTDWREMVFKMATETTC